MVVWGAVWGGVLGYLWPGSWEELQVLVGAGLGALSGLMLRSAIRTELRKLQAPLAATAKAQAAAAAPAARAAPPMTTAAPAAAATPLDFQDTFPQAPEPDMAATVSQQ